MPMVIYKILLEHEYKQLKSSGIFLGSKVDKKDGFIHFSTSTQILETLQIHFTDALKIYILSFNSNSMSNLHWERARNGDLFPHLYGQIRSIHIRSEIFLKKVRGNFHVPTEFLENHA